MNAKMKNKLQSSSIDTRNKYLNLTLRAGHSDRLSSFAKKSFKMEKDVNNPANHRMGFVPQSSALPNQSGSPRGLNTTTTSFASSSQSKQQEIAKKLAVDRFPINLVYDQDNRFSQFTQLLNKAATNQFKRDHFRNEALNNTFALVGAVNPSRGSGMD